MARVHPTAIVHPRAELAEDVEIGPWCMVESDVKIGPCCVLREHVVIRRYTTMGQGNFVDAHAVLGGEPQDLKFDPATVSYLRIGDRNVFREGVTISRATGEGNATTVGSGTYWMAGAHAGHNATIEDEVILANGAAVGGHATIGRRAILSGNVMVHQFCWIGQMAMSRGHAGASTHVPPYTMFANINCLVGLNTVGLRRARELTDEDRRQIKEAFRLTYRSHLPRTEALAAMDAHSEWGPATGAFRDFVRRVHVAQKPYKRALMALRRSPGGAE